MDKTSIKPLYIPVGIVIVLFILLSIGSLGYFLGTRSRTEVDGVNSEDVTIILAEKDAEIQRLKNALLRFESGNIRDTLDESELPQDKGVLGDTFIFKSDSGSVQVRYPITWVMSKKKGQSVQGVTDSMIYSIKSPRGSELIYYEMKVDNPVVNTYCFITDPSGRYTDNASSCIFFRDEVSKFARYKKLELAIVEGEWFITENVDEVRYEADPESYFVYRVRDSDDLEVLDEMMKTLVRSR